MSAPFATSSPRRTRGFTVIEIIVVLVILGLILTMAVPRMVGTETRLYRLTCDQVADLLTMYAQREAFSRQPIGLYYDVDQRRLEVLVYDVGTDATPGMPREARWRPDGFIQPVRIPEFVELIDVRADGDSQNITRWPLATRPGHERRTITIHLRGPNDERTTIALPSYAVAPRTIHGDRREQAWHEPVNLYQYGRGREDW